TGTTNGPTNVWFVGGTPDIVAGVYMGYDQPRPMGGYAQGGRIAAPVWKQWALTALKDQPKVPFAAPPGIRWVRIDRASGKAVFGVFPTQEDPNSPVIWEAFQPQTEPRRSYTASTGDPYDQQQQQQRRLQELNAKVEDPTLWDNPKAAQEVMRERQRLEQAMGATRAIERELADTAELMELAESEGDDALVDDGVRSLAELAERAERDKVAALLAGEADANNAYIEVNAGAGGTESQDWAEMLQRMYTRWAERHGMKVELIDHHPGEQAGIKSATLLIKG